MAWLELADIFRAMTLQGSLVRSFRLLAAILQLVVPGLAMVVDAGLEGERLAQQTHIESPSHDCAWTGHPQDCALCQFLRTASILQPTIKVALAPAPVGHFEGPHPLVAGSRQAALPFPRGPPVFS